MKQCESCEYFVTQEIETEQGTIKLSGCNCPEQTDDRYGEDNYVLWGEQTEEEAENAGMGPDADCCKMYYPYRGD